MHTVDGPESVTPQPRPYVRTITDMHGLRFEPVGEPLPDRLPPERFVRFRAGMWLASFILFPLIFGLTVVACGIAYVLFRVSDVVLWHLSAAPLNP